MAMIPLSDLRDYWKRVSDWVGSGLNPKVRVSDALDTPINPATIEKQNESNQLIETLEYGLVEIIRQLQAIRNDGGMADPTGRVRVAVESSATVPVSITANQDLRNVGGITAMGGFNLPQAVMNWNNIGAREIRNKISIS